MLGDNSDLGGNAGSHNPQGPQLLPRSASSWWYLCLVVFSVYCLQYNEAANNQYSILGARAPDRTNCYKNLVSQVSFTIRALRNESCKDPDALISTIIHTGCVSLFFSIVSPIKHDLLSHTLIPLCLNVIQIWQSHQAYFIDWVHRKVTEGYRKSCKHHLPSC